MVIRFLMVLCLLLVPTYAHALDCISGASGNWNAANWNDCGGSFPGVGDTATIQDGHTITLKVGASAVGTSPAGTTTYDLDINGVLLFENVAAAATLTVYSSIRIGATGVLRAGTSGSPLNCAGSARLTMATNAAAQNYTIYLNAGGTMDMHGCVTYHGSTATLTRARIASCAPDCTAGAVVVTLDRTHGWNASTGWVGDGIIVGVGGNETTPHAAGDDPELITTWTAPGATTIGITFTEDHLPGDIVENVTRNIVIDSDSATRHPRIYTSNNFHDPYSLSYIQLSEFGSSTSANFAAINIGSITHTMGSIDYVAVINSEDGSNTQCFYMYAKSWTSFEGNTCHDVRGGYGYLLFAATLVSTPILEFKDCSCYGSALGNPNGCFRSTTTQPIDVDGLWISHANVGIYAANWNGAGDIHNCLIHGTTGDGIQYTQPNNYTQTSTVKIHDNEIRNNGSDGVTLYGADVLFTDNNIDGTYRIGVSILASTSRPHIRMSGNTYDNCNTSTWTSGAAVVLYALDGDIRMDNESFGQTAVNGFANIMVYMAASTAGTAQSIVCNNCILSDPRSGAACGVMPVDGYYAFGCNGAGWDDVSRYQGGAITFQNKDQVEDAHLGWGHGGMVFSRQTGVVYTTSNLKMKITPCNSTAYSYIKIGSVYIEDATALTVDLALRKDTSVATTGRRPRIALEGCGFHREDDYDEMSDVDDTWELVQVSGTSEWKGVVHIYVGVMGEMDGVNGYQPVWPPTMDVYADGLVVTK